MINQITLLALSDSHDLHHLISPEDLPLAHLFIHAGDFTQNSFRGECRRFEQFLDKLPHQHKIVIAGNHDFVYDEVNYATKHKLKRHPHEKMNSRQEINSLKSRCTYLCHQQVQLLGLKIFGSPYQPLFFNWGFQYHHSRALDVWKDIPYGLDILITHGPPYGVLDLNLDGEHIGCPALREAILQKKPRVCIFGHVHNSTGEQMLGQSRCYNVAVLNQAYELCKKPTVIKIEKRIGEEGGEEGGVRGAQTSSRDD